MTHEELTDLIKRMIRIVGIEADARKVTEECAELVVALNRYLDGRGTLQELAEETADVSIMLEHIPHLLEAISRARNGQFVEKAEGFESMTSYYRKMKLQRLRQRVEHAEAKPC